MVTRDISQAAKLLLKALGRSGCAQVGFAIIYIILAGIIAAAPAALIGETVDKVSSGQSIWSTGVLNSIFLLCTALVTYELLQICRKHLVEGLAVQLQAAAQRNFADLLLKAPVDSLHGRQVGEIITLIDKGVTGLVRLMKLIFLELGPALAVALIAVLFVIAVHWVVAAVMIGVLICNAATTVFQIHTQRGVRINLLARRSEFNAQVGELVMNIDSVRASGVGSLERADFQIVSEAIRSTEFQHHKAMMIFDGFKGLFDCGGLIVVLLASLALFAAGTISSGDIVKIVLLYQNAVVPLRMLHRVVDESCEASVHVTLANGLTDFGTDVGLFGKEEFTDEAVCDNAFEASRLSYRVPGDGSALLNEITYTVPRQTFDVIVGKSGSGKTTLLRIMLGLCATYEGQAKVLGTEIKLADKEMLAKRICYVAQEPFIRSGDLRSNLQLGLHRTASDEELSEAARLAGIPLGEMSWIDGLDRYIAERGQGLSGGERQRIALARVFLSDAALLVLDEATSQLDEPMEDQILKNLKRTCASAAIVMVAHRTSARKWANRGFKLDHGRLVQILPRLQSLEPLSMAMAPMLKRQDQELPV